MTDYAKPVAPDVALERVAKDVRDRAQQHRRAASLEQQLAEECEAVASELDAEAHRYRQWQPEPAPPCLDPGAHA